MGNDLLKNLEEKINEAIETIELSRMEISDLKEQNEELENRYADWEIRLSTLIEKFEQLEDSEDADVEEVNAAIQDAEEDSEEEVVVADAFDSEDADVEEVSSTIQDTEEEPEEEVVAADGSLDLEDAVDEEGENSDYDDEELGSTFDTSADSFTESSESAQHYA